MLISFFSNKFDLFIILEFIYTCNYSVANIILTYKYKMDYNNKNCPIK